MNDAMNWWNEHVQIIHKHIPLLYFKQFSVKLWEENIAIKLSHDVCQVNQVTPRVLQRILSTNGKPKTSRLCWHFLRNAWKWYFIGHIYLVMYSGQGLCSHGGWMRKTSERKGRGELRLALTFLPCRPVSHQQSIWSLSGQQGGALTTGWPQHPNLDTQSGHDQEPSCKRINVQFIETEITFVSCWVFCYSVIFQKMRPQK